MSGRQPGHAIWTVFAVLLGLAVVASACGADATAEELQAGVKTAAAEDAARLRADLAATGDDGEADGGADRTTTVPAPVTTYAAITEEIREADSSDPVLLTPTGVLVGVAGITDSGVVVETPCGGITLVDSGLPVGEVDVVIDPGHGGAELGAADVPDLSEADLNLAVARATRDQLADRSINAVLTRDGDYRIPLTRRAALADLMTPEAFVSIHHNTPASRPSPVPGTEVYVQNGSETSRRLGGLLYEEVFAALDQFDVEWTARDDAGVLVVLNDDGEDSYGIARYPTTPTALVEMAYLGNEAEAEFLATPEYLEAAAIALADGIERFLTTEDPGTGFVEQPRMFNPLSISGGVTGCVDPALQ